MLTFNTEHTSKWHKFLERESERDRERDRERKKKKYKMSCTEFPERKKACTY